MNAIKQNKTMTAANLILQGKSHYLKIFSPTTMEEIFHYNKTSQLFA